MANSGRFFTSSHKVDLSDWNETHQIGALGSATGEVSVRRLQGKQGWKTDLFGETGLMWSDDAELSKNSTTLLAICWSPDGEVLACSMNSGLVHFLDVEHGRIMFTLRTEKPLQTMNWFRAVELDKLDELNFADYDHLAHCKTPEFAMKTDSQLNNKEEQQEMEDLGRFVTVCLREGLMGTILVGATSADEGSSVYVYAAGVLQIAHIDPVMDGNIRSEVELDPFSIEVQSLNFGPQERDPHRLWVTYSAVGRVRPANNYGNLSFLFGYDLRLSDFRYMANVMGIANRTALLYQTVVMLREIYSYMVKDWTQQSSFFQNRWKVVGKDTGVKRPNVDYCSNLLDSILTGQMAPVVFTYLHDTAKEIGTAQMHKFLDERFSELIQILSGPLTVAGHIIHYQIIQLLEEFVAFKETDRLINVFQDFTDLAQYPEDGSSAAPDRVDYVKERELQKAKEAVILLGRRIFETKIVSFANRKDLKMLVKYFSISPPMVANLKNQKSKEELLRANDTFETQPLINYIIATFGNYEICDNDMIRNELEDPLEQMLVKLHCIRQGSKENTREHSVTIEAKTEEPQLDRICGYFKETSEGTDLPKELELNASWKPMWAEHHAISEQEYDNLKDSHRTLKQSVDLIRTTYAELASYVGAQIRWNASQPEVLYV